MFFKKPAGQPNKARGTSGDAEAKPPVDAERLETAFFRISTAISAHDKLPSILELIARESLICLKAHRSTIFLMEGKSGALKHQFTCAPIPAYEEVSFLEEKEIAQRAIQQMKIFLLGKPEDFSDFIKFQQRGRRISSLMCIPLLSRGKPIGALSTVLFDGGSSFNEKNLQLLSIFSNHASMAIENNHLQEELEKKINFQRSYQRYFNDALNQLRNISEEERTRIDEHIGQLMQGQAAGDSPFGEPQPVEDGEPVMENSPSGEEVERVDEKPPDEVEPANEPLPSAPPGATSKEQGEPGDRMERLECRDMSLGPADDLATGGIFIPTSNPMDLGEQFILRLQMSDGGEPIEAACKVIWTNRYGKDTDDLRRGMVVKLLNLEPEALKRIEQRVRPSAPPDAPKFL